MSIEQDAAEFMKSQSGTATKESSQGSSIEDDAQAFLQSQAPEQSSAPSAMSGMESEFGGSPLSWTSRLALSFAGDNKENVLKRDYKFVETLPNGKFAVGNDPRALMPIDPEGIFNDVLGDIADVANWVAPMVGSTAAAVAAAPADIASGSPLPSILAAGRGMAIGEGFNQVLGKKLGVSDETPGQMAGDVALAGAGGAAGQGAGMLAGKALNASIPALGSMVDKLAGKLPQQVRQGFDAALRKTLKIAAAVDEKATEVGQRVGFRNLLTPKNMSEGEITNIARDVVENASKTEKRLGVMVDDAVGKLHSITRGKPVISTGKPLENLTKQLKDINLLHEGNFINKNYPAGQDRSFFQKLFAELGARRQVKVAAVEDAFSRPVRKETFNRFVSPAEKIPFKKLVQLKRGFASEFDKLSPRAQAIYSEFMNGLMKEAETVSKQAGTTVLQDANAEFSKYMGTTEMLRQAGLDVNSAISADNFMRRTLKMPDIVQQELTKLDSMIGGDVLERATQWNAAQNFKTANPGMLRLSMISGLLGGSFGGGDIKERGVRAAVFAGIGLGGLSGALRLGEEMGSIVMKAKSAKMAQQSQMLAKLLQSAAGPAAGFSAKENLTQRNQNNNE